MQGDPSSRVGKTCLEFGLWPHLATCFIKSAALGHKGLGSAGMFLSHSHCHIVCSPEGLPSVCLLLKCHDSAKLKRQETELDGSLVWSQVTNPLLWLRLEAGGCWKWGRRQNPKKSRRCVCRHGRWSHMPPACLHTCPPPDGTQTADYLSRESRKCQEWSTEKSHEGNSRDSEPQNSRFYVWVNPSRIP